MINENIIFFFADGVPYFRSQPQSQSVKPQHSVSLQCPVEPATANITWIFNGEILQSMSSLGMSQRGTELRISSFSWQPHELSHVGTYQCMASTRKGTIVSKEAMLTKAGKF